MKRVRLVSIKDRGITGAVTTFAKDFPLNSYIREGEKAYLCTVNVDTDLDCMVSVEIFDSIEAFLHNVMSGEPTWYIRQDLSWDGRIPVQATDVLRLALENTDSTLTYDFKARIEVED